VFKWYSSVQIVQVDDRDREKLATRHFLSHGLFRQDLLGALGMDSLTWVVMEVQKPSLIPGLVGDVDILAGNLAFNDVQEFVAALDEVRQQFQDMHDTLRQDLACKKVTEANGLKWPPVSSRVIGVEVKCGYFDHEDGPQSTKSSPKKVDGTRGQIQRLFEMGMDMVALLDVIGNDPAHGRSAYFEAGWQARESARSFQSIIEARLPDDTSAAQFCWAVASVFDRDEHASGGGGLLPIRRGLRNPLLNSADPYAMDNRRLLVQNVSMMLGMIPVPRYCPVVFIHCQDCRRLHFLDDPNCIWKPRDKVPTASSASSAARPGRLE
jgi:hypothetical protein